MGMTARGLEITVQAVAWAVLATSFVAMVAGTVGIQLPPQAVWDKWPGVQP
jgi:hypothetical protein